MRLVRGNDVWELRAFVGRDDTGRVRHRYTTFHGSKRQASAALARLVAETDAHRTTDQPATLPHWGPDTSINDAITGWQENGWEDLSPSTVRRYQSMWSVHVRASIGRVRIADLSPYEVERYFRVLKTAGLSEAPFVRSEQCCIEPAGWRENGGGSAVEPDR